MGYLETERLILRRFREEDFGDFCEFAIDPEMCRMMGRENITDPESARYTFDWLKDREPRGYVLELKETGKVIGNLTVTEVPDYLAEEPALQQKQGKALSFSISRPYQRRGLMTEAVNGVIRKLFREENVDYISCGHFDFNIASREMQKKLGFSHLRRDVIALYGETVTGIENVLWREPQIAITPLEEADRQAMLELLTDPVIGRTYMLPEYESTEAVERLFCRFLELSHSEAHYIRGIRAGEGLAGFINDTGMENGVIELGWVIHPALHNRGYATGAVKMAIEELFSLGFREVMAGAFEDNSASLRVMQKCGMSRIDREESMEYRGNAHRCIYYSIQNSKKGR